MSTVGSSDSIVGTEATAPAIRTTGAAFIGLAFGPSVIAVLAFGIFVRPIEQEFGWSRLQVSLAATIVAYMTMLVSPLQGMLVDRYGARSVVLTSIPLFAAGLVLFQWLSPSLTVFYFLWALLPLLAIGLWPMGYLRIVSGWFERKLGLALGIANAGIGIGSIVVPFLASRLIADYGWRAAFVALGVIVLVVTWPTAYFFLKASPEEQAAKQATGVAATYGLDFRQSIRLPTFRWMLAAYFLLGVATTSLITQQVPMLIDAGWTPQRAALVQSIFGVGLMFGRVGVGYLIDYVFAPFVMAAIALGGALGCAIYALAPSSGLAFVSACLIGLVVGAEFDVLAYVTKRYFGTAAFGKLYGVVFAVFQLASGLGIAALSMSRGYFGSYTVGFTLFGVVLLLCAVLFMRLGPFTYAVGTRPGDPARQ
jgi:MFS family permease